MARLLYDISPNSMNLIYKSDVDLVHFNKLI